MAEHYVYNGDGVTLKPLNFTSEVTSPTDFSNPNAAANPDDLTASISTKGGVAVAKNLEVRDTIFVNRGVNPYTPDPNYDDVVVRGASNAGMTVATEDATSLACISFDKVGAGTSGFIMYSHTPGTDDSMVLAAGTTSITLDENASGVHIDKLYVKELAENVAATGITVLNDMSAPSSEISADVIRTDTYDFDVLAGDPAAPAAGKSRLYYNSGSNLLRVYDIGTGSYVDLDTGTSDVTGGANVGVGLGKLFKQKNGTTLEFKSLLDGGTGVLVTDGVDNVALDLDEDISVATISERTGGAGVTVEKVLFVDNFVRSADATGAMVVESKPSSSGSLTLRSYDGNLDLTVAGSGSININDPYNLSVGAASKNISVNTDSLTVNGSTVPLDGANVGTGAGTLFKTKSGSDLQFKRVAAGSGISVTNGTNDVTIATTGGERYIGAIDFTEGASKPSTVKDNSFLVYLEFDDGKDVIFSHALPTSYTNGSSVDVEVIWAEDGTGGNVRWDLGYRRQPQGGTLTNTASAVISTTTAVPGTDTITKSVMTVPGTGLVTGDVLSLQLERDAASTSSNKSQVFGVRIKWT